MNCEIIFGRLSDIARSEWDLDLTDAQISQFIHYADLLIEWNTKLNLTRLIEPDQIAVGHFLDSLTVLKAFTIPEGASVIDVGTGAGMPGIALKIARPDLQVTLLDSTAKKLLFCDTVIRELGLTGIKTDHARAEEHASAGTGFYDFVVARAVAPLERLLPWCAPLVKSGGEIIALKGLGLYAEMPGGLKAALRLGLQLKEPLAVELPGEIETITRYLVVAVRTVDAAKPAKTAGARELDSRRRALKQKKAR